MLSCLIVLMCCSTSYSYNDACYNNPHYNEWGCWNKMIHPEAYGFDIPLYSYTIKNPVDQRPIPIEQPKPEPPVKPCIRNPYNGCGKTVHVKKITEKPVFLNYFPD